MTKAKNTPATVAAIVGAQAATHAATVAYVIDRSTVESAAGIEARAAAIVWGAWNPAAFLAVMAGKTPPAWKGIKTNLAAGMTESKVRRWVTDSAKLGLILCGMSREAIKADVDGGKGPDLAKAQSTLEGIRLACQDLDFTQAVAHIVTVAGKIGISCPDHILTTYADKYGAIREAVNAAPAIEKQVETALETGEAMPPAPIAESPVSPKIQVANMARAMAALVAGGNDASDVSQKDILTLATALLRLATESTARRIGKEAEATADRVSAPTPEAEAIAAANEAQAAPAPAPAPRKVRAKASEMPLSNRAA